jgi:hypothetical protein
MDELLLLRFRYGIGSYPLTERAAIASPTGPLTAKTRSDPAQAR